MRMTDSEALTLIGNIAMRSMGVLLVIASTIPMSKEARAYIKRQREWYEQQQDMMNAAEQVDELMGESE